MQDRLASRLSDGINRLKLIVTNDDQQRLLALINLLKRWSKAYNLTAVRDPVRMVPYHLLDSLAVAPYLRGERVLDVGTGAGFPGLPLAIVQPDRHFVLLDSNGKKIRFVRQAVMELGIRNVNAVQARIETYESGQKFATILARAFASLPDILRLTGPLLDQPGVLLALKSRQAGDELKTLDKRPESARLHRLDVPFLDGERTLIEIESN